MSCSLHRFQRALIRAAGGTVHAPPPPVFDGTHAEPFTALASPNALIIGLIDAALLAAVALAVLAMGGA